MNKEIWEKPKRACDIGGEALIEGVMMRGNGRMAVAVRLADGTIDVEKSEYVAVGKKYPFLKLPFVRGAVAMIESMLIGVRALLSSAEKVELSEAVEANDAGDGKPGSETKTPPAPTEDKFDLFMKKILGDNYFQFMLYFSVAFALVIGIGVFMLLPSFLTDLLFHFDKSTGTGALVANLIEGVIRILLFLAYIGLVSRNKDIRRVFQYHGAEHKTIYAFESNEELTVENVRRHTTLHPRCGTAFLFVVMIISILVFAFAGWHNRLLNMVFRLLLLPVVMGISYEAFKVAAKTGWKPLRMLTMPGLMLQKITTKEPDDSMIEVAIAALKGVVEVPTAASTETVVSKADAGSTLCAETVEAVPVMTGALDADA